MLKFFENLVKVVTAPVVIPAKILVNPIITPIANIVDDANNMIDDLNEEEE